MASFPCGAGHNSGMGRGYPVREVKQGVGLTLGPFAVAAFGHSAGARSV